MSRAGVKSDGLLDRIRLVPWEAVVRCDHGIWPNQGTSTVVIR